MPRPSRRPRDEDEDDLPRRRRRDDEDDDRPARSRRVVDEDERPRKRGRPDDGVPPGTPRVYVHRKCGKKTEMPADVIRDYLENPFAYGHQTTCDYCDKVVPWKNCEWVETDQNLLEYFEDMQARLLLTGEDPRTNKEGGFLIWFAPLFGGIFLGLGGALLGYKMGSALIGGVAGLLLGVGVGFIHYYRETQDFEQIREEYDRQLFKKFYDRHPDEKPKKKKARRADDE
jgi:hypothetical protein